MLNRIPVTELRHILSAAPPPQPYPSSQFLPLEELARWFVHRGFFNLDVLTAYAKQTTPKFINGGPYISLKLLASALGSDDYPNSYLLLQYYIGRGYRYIALDLG